VYGFPTDPVTASRGLSSADKAIFERVKDCTTSQVYLLCRAKLGTTFREVRSDADLQALVKEFVAPERALCQHFLKAESPMMCWKLLSNSSTRQVRPAVHFHHRIAGVRMPQSLFHEWHELGHLLILTRSASVLSSSARTLFTSSRAQKSRCVDVIAGGVRLLRTDGAPLL